MASTTTTPPSSSDTLELANPTATNGLTSSTSEFFTNTAASATETAGSDQPSFATTSSLYLFTFLATLLVLLAISCAIVIRSLVIRRRFQRRVQEALAEGYVFPPGAGPGAAAGFPGFGAAGRRRIDIGEKPKMWDAHIAPPPSPDKSKEMAWRHILPVSVRIQSDKLTGAGQQPPPPPAGRPSFLGTASFGLMGNGRHYFNWRRPRFLGGGRSSQPDSGPSPESQRHGNGNADASQDPQNSNADDDSVTVLEDAKLQISIMIAMPSRYRPRVWREGGPHHRQQEQEHGRLSRRPSQSQRRNELSEDGDEEEELPEVVLGTAEMPWKVAVPITRSPGSDSNPNSNPDGRRDTETESPNR